MSENGGEKAVERQYGASMIEQLVPEITTHALSYLDYASLCRVSITSSLMRKAANDDNVWKVLYHKDFTLEQENVTLPNGWNGWKAYYAVTRSVITANAEFFRIIKERLIEAMRQFWLHADYVKCFQVTGGSFYGYNAVMSSWEIALDWEIAANFLIQDVRVRVASTMAWVTMIAYLDMGAGPFHVTNIFELHDGRWYMVHHHCSALFIHAVGQHQINEFMLI